MRFYDDPDGDENGGNGDETPSTDTPSEDTVV